MRLSLAGRSAASARSKAQAPGRALFGIVQGGDDPALRIESARALIDIGFPGYAIGGLAVGEPQEVMLKMVEEVAPALPADRPRYLMGVGRPDDLIEAVARGIDMFDCVMPTRDGRHGRAFTRFGAINLRNARHAEDPRPLDEQSPCEAARDLFARLSASPDARGRDARRDAAVGDQSRLLPGADAGHPRGDRRGRDSPTSRRATRAAWERGDIPRAVDTPRTPRRQIAAG